MVKKIIRMVFLWLAAAAVSAYFVFAAVSFSTINGKTICNDLRIYFEGSDTVFLLTRSQIAEILKRNELYPLGEYFENINIDKMENLLKANRMLQTAECYKIPSGAVIIQIKQRKPVFTVNSGNSYYIGNQRDSIPISPNYTADLPLVSGAVNVKTASGRLYDFVNYIDGDEFWHSQIVQINICPNGKTELVMRIGEAIVLLGSLENYQKKLENLYQFLTRVSWNKYDYISLDYKNQIICRKAAAPPVATPEAAAPGEINTLL
jgi:cell division protein FtsQ